MLAQRRLSGPSAAGPPLAITLLPNSHSPKISCIPTSTSVLFLPLQKRSNEGWEERCFSAVILGGASERFSEQMVRNLSGLHSHHCFSASFSEP